MPESEPESGSPKASPSTRGAQTRRRLLDATLVLVARKGVGAFTVREVVKEAGSSLGVLTYHFPTRHDLLTAAAALQAERDATPSGVAPIDPAAGTEVDLDAATDHVIDLLVEMVHERRAGFLASRDLALESLRDPTLSNHSAPTSAGHRLALAHLLVEVGSSDPDIDANLLALALEGLGQQWLANAGDREFDATLGRSVRRLLEKFVRNKD